MPYTNLCKLGDYIVHTGFKDAEPPGDPLLLQLAPNPKNILNIERTVSLALIMKKYHANLGVIRMKNGAATAASAKHKCYSFTTIMYYLKILDDSSLPNSLLVLHQL